MASMNSFGTQSTLTVGGRSYTIHSLSRLEAAHFVVDDFLLLFERSYTWNLSRQAEFLPFSRYLLVNLFSQGSAFREHRQITMFFAGVDQRL
jgi:hypothetical protein